MMTAGGVIATLFFQGDLLISGSIIKPGLSSPIRARITYIDIYESLQSMGPVLNHIFITRIIMSAQIIGILHFSTHIYLYTTHTNIITRNTNA